MALAQGTRLGPYEITFQIGVGGMGEVYRAIDTNLGREVAIKVLPESFAQDGDRLARFEREAKTLASLNHPNIAIVHGFEKSSGMNGLVMELVEGPTLAERITEGPVPIEEALAIAKQIAEALESAHERGIVHRDLKPGNIKLRPDGTVKVLDFGLAKAMEPAIAMSPGLSHSPTITTPAMTQAGLILGTAAYMSPEQARGKPVDRRADIWAFGCVLYEMLTGQRAFGGEDVTVTLARVVEREPDLDLLPPDTPARVRKAVRVCLRKDPRQRGGDIAAIRLALEGAFETSAPQTSERVPIPRPLWRRAAPLAVVTTIALVLAFVAFRPNPLPEVMRFQIHAPPGSTLPLGTPAVSPDGHALAYAVSDSTGVTRLHVRPIDRVETRVLPGTEGAVHPFWSPDGRSLAFLPLPGRQLTVIDVEGGAPRVVAKEVGSPWSGTWNQNGDLLYWPAAVTMRISAQGGTPTPVTSLDQQRGETQVLFPFFLPDGERFLVRVTSRDRSSIQLAILGTMGRTMVVDDVDSAPILAPSPGGKTYLLYLRAPDLMAQEFDQTSGSVRGDPAVLVSNIGQVGAPPVHPAVGVSPSGILAYQTGGVQIGRLTWVDRSGTEVEKLRAESTFFWNPQLSPDGSRAAGFRFDPSSGATDVWVTDLQRASSTRVTFGNENESDAVWSPDSTRVAFRRRGGTREPGIFVVDVNGGGNEQRLTTTPGTVTSWSPGGRYVLYDFQGRLTLLPVIGDEKPVDVGSRNGRSRHGRFSPDGNYISFTSDETGRDEVWLQAMPPGKGSWKVSVNGGVEPRWRKDSKEMFFVAPDGAVMAVAVRAAHALPVGVPQELFRQESFRLAGWTSTFGYDVRADGQWFLVSGLGEGADDAPITVVVNWWVELE
ncbi:MAG TPA: protein kinase [Vicinamibacterales bacterium]|nr:protein kinase [Vicinamibacterales bacterium]